MPFLWVNIMSEFFKVEYLCYGYLKKPLCLKDVCFSAGKKDKVLILAKDDSGKTTLLKALSGFDDKFFGKVFCDKKEIRTIPDNEKQFSVIFDKPILIGGSIDKNLNYLCENNNLQNLSESEKLEILKKINLNFKLKDNIKKLTVFEQFKFCLIRSYIKNSRVIFIDDVFKNKLSDEEKQELIDLINDLFADKLVFLCANQDSFLSNKTIFEKFNPSKILYLNLSQIHEYKDFDTFFDNPIDLDAVSFNDDLSIKNGYCIKQDGDYYLCFDDKFEIKVDKKLNEKFDKLKLGNNDNEDIVFVHKKEINVDFSKNNDFNKLMLNKIVMIFSKLDRSKVI